MNVDTGEFQALTERVEAIEAKLAREDRMILELVRGAAHEDEFAGMRHQARGKRKRRRLRVVE